MGVTSGVCIALVLLRLMMLVLHCNASMITTSGPFVVLNDAQIVIGVMVVLNSAILE